MPAPSWVCVRDAHVAGFASVSCVRDVVGAGGGSICAPLYGLGCPKYPNVIVLVHERMYGAGSLSSGGLRKFLESPRADATVLVLDVGRATLVRASRLMGIEGGVCGAGTRGAFAGSSRGGAPRRSRSYWAKAGWRAYTPVCSVRVRTRGS